MYMCRSKLAVKLVVANEDSTNREVHVMLGQTYCTCVLG